MGWVGRSYPESMGSIAHGCTFAGILASLAASLAGLGSRPHRGLLYKQQHWTCNPKASWEHQALLTGEKRKGRGKAYWSWVPSHFHLK